MHISPPKSKIALVFFLISLGLTVVAVVLITRIFPDIVNNEVNKNVRLAKGTEQYERFVELPFPVSLKVYFFNIENPSEIVKGQKPVVKEVGPYVYKEYRSKTINATNDEDDTISYTQMERFEFDHEASGNLSDEDHITTLNAAMMAVIQLADDFGHADLLSTCLKDMFPVLNTVFIKVKVRDILFDGIQFCQKHLSLCELRTSLACKIAETRKNIDKVDDGSLKFSFLNYKAKSNDGLYTVKRGIQNIQTLGRIVSLNNEKYTHFWKRVGTNSTCDEIKGTDGTLYPPKIDKNSTIEVYSTDICRVVEVKFLQETMYKDIRGFMFTASNSTLTSKDVNKEEDCFCAKQTKGVNGEYTCFLDGVIDLQPCTGAPVLLSFPHFLWADRSYIENVSGLSPNEDFHRTFLIVEPDTGTPLQGVTRIQMNSVLRPIHKVGITENLPRAVLPLFWIEEGISLSDEYTDKLREMYFQKVSIINIIKWAFLGGTVILTMITASYIVCKTYTTRKRQNKVDF